MKELRFAPSAEHSLDEIFIWSIENFGPQRAQTYRAEIVETCKRIAAGTAHTQSCNVLAPDDLNTNMRFARSGRHFIVFEEFEDLIGIIYFLHSSSDLGAQLAALTP